MIYKELVKPGQKLVKVLDRPATWIYVPSDSTEEFIEAKRKEYQKIEEDKRKSLRSSLNLLRDTRKDHFSKPKRIYMEEVSLTQIMNNIKR